MFLRSHTIFVLSIAAAADTESSCLLAKRINPDGSVELSVEDTPLLQLGLSANYLNVEPANVTAVAPTGFVDDLHQACADDLDWSEAVMKQLGSAATVLCHRYLAVAYSQVLRNPLLVAFDLEPHEQKLNSGGRKGFVSDPSLVGLKATFTRSSSTCFGPQDNGDSWDRGHMAPSYAFTWKADALKETYYMSNVAPQAARFNRVSWRLMEEHLTDYVVCKKSSLLVVVGTAYDYPNEDPPTLAGTAIPSHFWIAVCNKDSKESAAKYGRNVNDFEDQPEGMEEFVSVDALLGRSFMQGTGLTDIFGGHCNASSLLDLEGRRDMDKCSDVFRDEALGAGKAGDAAATDAVPTCAVEKDGGKLVLWKYLEDKRGYNKGVIVKNVGDAAVSLGDYYLKLAMNGGRWLKTPIKLDTQANDALGAGEELVVLHKDAKSSDFSRNIAWLYESRPASQIASGAPEDVRTSSLKFNGNDAVGLFNCDALTDKIGEVQRDGERRNKVQSYNVSSGAGGTRDDRLQRSSSATSGCVGDWADVCSEQWSALGLK